MCRSESLPTGDFSEVSVIICRLGFITFGSGKTADRSVEVF